MNFDFLNNVTIEKPVVETKANTGRKAMPKNPENGLTIRLFKDGSIYPSQELVDKYNLEYGKDKVGNGLDIFTSMDWKQYPQDAESVVFIAVVPRKDNARISLFSSAREVDGELTSVMNQGSKTFGVELITMLQQTYENSLFNENKYVDLQIVDSVQIPQDVVYVPKMTNKGEHKGMMTTERRENVVLMPLAIKSTEDIEVGKEQQVAELV